MPHLTMSPESCPRFPRCNAPICPLDPHWRTSCHLKGEKACHYLKLVLKLDGAAKVRAALPPAAAEAVIQATPGIAQLYPTLARALARSAVPMPEAAKVALKASQKAPPVRTEALHH